MYCPETIKVCNDLAYIVHHGAGDVPWEYRSLAERWNPLRWEISLWRKPRGGYRVRLNYDGGWGRAISNGIFWIKQACRKARV